jgi:hypothetical protein
MDTRPMGGRADYLGLAGFMILFAALIVAALLPTAVMAERSKNFTISNAGNGTAITVTSAHAYKLKIYEDPTTCANDYQVKMPATSSDAIKKLACTTLTVEGYFSAGDTVAYVKSLGADGATFQVEEY